MNDINTTAHSGKLRNMASVYLLQSEKILLLYRTGNSIVKNLWIGSAGGHFEPNESSDAKACMLRELSEELSIQEHALKNLSLRYITLRYTDGEVRQNYYFFADVDDLYPQIPISTEGITQWFSLNEAVKLPMPITAKYVIKHYWATGQFDSNLYCGISNENGLTFQKL